MCDLSVDLSAVAAHYGKTAEHFRGEIEMLAPMVEDGVARIDGDRITVPEEGRPLMRAVCAIFDAYLGNGVGRHSQAV
jgi:oxygen-independent coproporphyrinogen-3 oxidase